MQQPHQYGDLRQTGFVGPRYRRRDLPAALTLLERLAGRTRDTLVKPELIRERVRAEPEG